MLAGRRKSMEKRENTKRSETKEEALEVRHLREKEGQVGREGSLHTFMNSIRKT